MGISVRGVEKRYVSRGKETSALQHVDLEIASGEFVAFVGPSGCGKSTLLNMIAGIVPASAGQILHDGRIVADANRNVGYMTQGDSVLPWYTVERNVDLPLKIQNVAGDERRRRVADWLGRVGLAGFEASYPAELSGGMRKRVALAQVLVYDPSTLLMDEPFGALDAMTRERLQDDLLDIWRSTGLTVIFVTHSIEEAILLADRVVVMEPGPGRIAGEYRVELPRPRDVASPEFNAVRRDLGARLHSHHARKTT